MTGVQQTLLKTERGEGCKTMGDRYRDSATTLPYQGYKRQHHNRLASMISGTTFNHTVGLLSKMRYIIAYK